MSRIKRTLIAVVLLLCLHSSLVTMAETPGQAIIESEEPSTQITVEQDQQATQVILETNIPIKLELNQKPALSCEATIEFEYLQRNTTARIEGAIENKTCTASGGDYTIAVRIRDENGDVKTLEFKESWHRSDDQPVKIFADYKIGADVDLIGARSRRLSCVCAGAPEE